LAGLTLTNVIIVSRQPQIYTGRQNRKKPHHAPPL